MGQHLVTHDPSTHSLLWYNRLLIEDDTNNMQLITDWSVVVCTLDRICKRTRPERSVKLSYIGNKLNKESFLRGGVLPMIYVRSCVAMLW